MTFSFIVIGRAFEDCAPALESLKQIRRGDDFEVLVAIGRNPSQQRNVAAAKAQGRYLIFLDNDSRADARLLHYYRDALAYSPDIKIVGGPSLYDGRKSYLMRNFQSVFSSVFGLGPFRARYSSLGRVRKASERDLILCNLLIDRNFFLSEGGFHLDLYPNEENEFLNRVRLRAKSYYHPLAICRRDSQKTLFEFVAQIFRYGRGRAKHLVLYPSVWNQIFLLSVAFSTYIIAAFALLFAAPTFISLGFLLAPLELYAAFAFAASLFAAFEHRRAAMAVTLPGIFFLCHFSYGLGLLAGLLTYPFIKRARALSEIEVRHFKREPLSIQLPIFIGET